MRRLLLLALVCAAGLAAGGADAAPPLRVTQAGGAQFPDRQFVVGFPSGVRVAATRIHVLENGSPVANLSVLPAGDAGRRAFGVVLAIDASNSMRGAALARARDAAIAFVADQERFTHQQVAIVYFNNKARVALPFTNDAETLIRALEAPVRTAPETHIYDAIATSTSLLRKAGIAAGSIVVLSDGSDTGSRIGAARATRSARTAHARIFAIGLRSRAFRPATLRSLAAGSRGEYVEAASATQLGATYHALSAQLAGEYLVRYRSAATASQHVHVTVTVDGAGAFGTASYVAPSIAAAPAAGFRRSFGERFWQSPLALLLVAAGIGLLFGLVVVAFARRDRTGVRRRVAEFAGATAAPEQVGAVDTGMITGRTGSAELTARRAELWERFELQLALADVPLSAAHVAMLTLAGTLLVALVATAVAGPVGLLLAVTVPVAVYTFVKSKLQRRRAKFAEQLPDNLQVIASALRAGHSLVGALAVLAEDVAEPSQTEFRRVLADEQVGVPLENALADVGERMGSRDLAQISVVAALQRETGGNSAEVIDRVTETIRQRFELRRLVKTLTTQGRMSRWVVSLLPVVLFFVINLINPDYMKPLYENSGGRVLIAVAAAMVVSGSYVIKRIVNIKV